MWDAAELEHLPSTHPQHGLAATALVDPRRAERADGRLRRKVPAAVRWLPSTQPRPVTQSPTTITLVFTSLKHASATFFEAL